MTALVVACAVIVLVAVLIGYLVIAVVVMAVRSSVGCASAIRVAPQAPQVSEPPRWTALDDQQVARYLKQSPP